MEITPPVQHGGCPGPMDFVLYIHNEQRQRIY